jgi:hypothetical protein
MSKANKLIIDIETLSPDKVTDGGVVITEIAARAFSIEGNHVIKKDLFTSVLDVKSQLAAGLRYDQETLNWHVNQGRKIEELMTQQGEDLQVGVDRFVKWCTDTLEKKSHIYAWGSDFDVPMILKSYAAYTKKKDVSDNLFPWWYSNYRCARTLFNELTEEHGRASKKPHVAALDVDIELNDIVTAWNFRRTNKLIIL